MVESSWRLACLTVAPAYHPAVALAAEFCLWKNVRPSSTAFAWLSREIVHAFCWDALQKDGTREYGNFGVPHLGLGNDFSAKFIIQDLFYLGETRSAEDLAVFTRITSERLCLGCGLLADEAFCPIPPHDRSGLFKATIRLRQLVLSDTVPQGLTAEQEALKALMPSIFS